MDDELESGNTHHLRDLLGYRLLWQGEIMWGFTTAGLKEVLRGVGDFATLVAELAERGVIHRGSEERLQIEKKNRGYETTALRSA